MVVNNVVRLCEQSEGIPLATQADLAAFLRGWADYLEDGKQEGELRSIYIIGERKDGTTFHTMHAIIQQDLARTVGVMTLHIGAIQVGASYKPRGDAA